MTTPRRSSIYGPEPWLVDGDVVWSHWDLWFCLVACLDQEGDLAVLADTIAEGARLYGGSDAERKLSHLADLAARLRDTGLDARGLVARAEDRPALRTKARNKVLRQGLYGRDLTDAMRSTPRQRLYERALRGRWDRFPASPLPWYERMLNGLGERWLSKNATFRLARRIEGLRDRHDRATADDPAHKLAARRALVTYMYETLDRCDDSYGVLGEVGREALLTYAKLPYEPARVPAEDWCEDVCELLAWESHGLLLDRETAVFEQMHGMLADHAERFLLALSEELRAQRLEYEADEALQIVAYMHIAHARLTRFAPTAALLGSDHWRPIVTMVEAALARRRKDVARATFAAADRPGMHQRYLRERCAELIGSLPA